MNNKPMLFVTDDLAEGVYAASGSSSESVSYKLNVTQEGSQYYKWNGYSISFTNNTGKTLSTFSVQLTSNKNISSVKSNYFLMTAKIINSNTLELTYTASEDWAKLAPGNTSQAFGFEVEGDVPFTLQ